MLRPVRKLVNYTSSSKGAKITLVAWLIAVVLLSVLAPSAKEYEGNSTESSINKDTPSELAGQMVKEQFPSDEGLTALLVFHRDSKISQDDREKISQFSEWLSSDEKPEHIKSALPFHRFPESVQDQMFSEDETTLLFNVSLEPNIESDVANDTMNLIRDQVESLGLEQMDFEITGPAGISADTISLFRNADFVLMIATIGLIFVILIIIYRSPLLAVTPLIIAAIVYGVVDRVLGIAGKNEWFAVDGSAVSIMLVLLFAVLTDYSLFVFSRYREELTKQSSKYGAIQEAMHHVSEPIFFSGGTVFLAMLTLFVTVFEPYNHFAPIFSVAVVIILLAGLTLIPSVFALLGRKAFWPFVPKVEQEKKKKRGFWKKVSKVVIKHPAMIAGLILIFLLAGVANVASLNFSFNLLKSFPEDISSRQGFEILEEHYPAGQLAPVTVLLHSEEEVELDQAFADKVNRLVDRIKEVDGIDSVTPSLTEEMIEDPTKLPRNFLAEDQHAFKLSVVLDGNPYETDALNTVEELRDVEEDLLANSGFSEGEALYYAGQTAEQLDVKQMNQRDMIVLFSLVTVLLTIVLGFQTKSVLMPILMMATILLSFFAALGFGWLIFKYALGLDAISYRLPVYTFVFMIALGIDYNIMLVSRIRELSKSMSWKEAVGEGVALTGGVISSAGLILAATFSVLMTQPLQELFLFGFTMALGILLDTFLIRGFFLPSLLILLYGKKKVRE